MKNILLLCLILYSIQVFSQSDTLQVESEEIPPENNSTIRFERPMNIFAAAGIHFPLKRLYHVVISPLDLHVKLEPYPTFHTNITTGLVWNPLMSRKRKIVITGKNKWHFTYKRNPFAIALLMNIFDLSISATDTKMDFPLELGFGLGYRKDDFMVLLTTEFKSVRQPYKYFIDAYKDGNKPLQYFENTIPEIEIKEDNDTFFTNQLIPAIGFKIAYAFTKK